MIRGFQLVKLSGFGPGGEFRDDVELAEQLANKLAGILALTQLLELLEDASERFLGLGNRPFRVVLALAFKALVMLAELLAKELREALTRGARKGSRQTWCVDGRQTTLQGHAAEQDSVYGDAVAAVNRL